MAEPVSVAKIVKKLADQLECSICLDSFTDPKLLQCQGVVTPIRAMHSAATGVTICDRRNSPVTL